MARRIKRFMVFVFFSLFFTMFSKIFHSSDETSQKTRTLASASVEKSASTVGKVLSSVVGVKSAKAAAAMGCSRACHRDTLCSTWYCD